MTTRLADSLFFVAVILSTIAAAQEAAPQRVQVPDSVIGGLLVNRVSPMYPPLARQARIQGSVVLKVTISKSGDVGNVQLISGHPMLVPAAVDAVKQWKYQPYLLNGEPTEVETIVHVNFMLSDQPHTGMVGDMPGNPAPVVIEGALNDTTVPPGTVRVPEAVMRRMRVQSIDPIYPPGALQSRIQGLVVLKILIDKSGNVSGVELISGHPLLAPAAIAAVKQWIYTPFLLDGAPYPVLTSGRINFALSAKDSLQGTATDGLLDVGPEGIIGGTQDGTVGVVPPTPSGKLPQRIRISSRVAAGLLLTQVPPDYPTEAQARHIQGTVVLKVNIDSEGNVVQVEPINGDPMLLDAAAAAVRQWKYRPYLLQGTPLVVETTVQVDFSLSGN
ncbi:MAG TPA: energy transducer TonB [Verrucomicrobiae bacterium]|nr:energy transducer TonB [Verrucomicrobiae bacterium]